MKIIIGYLVGGLMFAIGFVWTIFEIIFYFGEKDSINWFSVGLLAFGFVIALLAIVLGFLYQERTFKVSSKKMRSWK